MARVKTVLVSVYVERPTRRRRANIPSHSDQNHHRQQVRWRPVRHPGRGYDRRAELLLYSQQLRALPRSPTASATNDPQEQDEIVPIRRRRKGLRVPTCSCNLKNVVNPVSLKKRPFSRLDGKGRKGGKEERKVGGSMVTRMPDVKMLCQNSGLLSKFLSMFRRRRHGGLDRASEIPLVRGSS